jgi:2-polyprenyl-3-methyl-5-hydroxy-6-metoxy-1,4-benzoquinol methylase
MTEPQKAPSEEQNQLAPCTFAMKRDWDQRARDNARWYINTLRLDQSEEEFDESGRRDVEGLVVADLPLLCDWRPAKQLRLLEIGCGIGRMSRHLASLFGEVVAIDVSGEMVRQARSRLATLPQVTFEETSGVDLSLFPDESFDVVFCAYVFQHIPSAAAIEANLREAFRVLRPRGVFKFITNGVRIEAGNQELDTWSGAPFPEAEVRRVAVSLGAQLLGSVGDGTQYCWSILRKRSSSRIDTAPQVDLLPRIRSVGRADDLRSTELAPRYDDLYLGIVLEGVLPEQVDATSVQVVLGEWTLLPCYAGRRGLFPGESVAEAAATDGASCQLNVRIPPPIPAGCYEGRVLLGDGTSLGPFALTLPAVVPAPPHLFAVTNREDGGLDLHATGPKARWNLFADRLPLNPQAATPVAESTLASIEIGLRNGPLERWMPAQRLSYLAANGVWEIEVGLPEEDPWIGPLTLQLRIGPLTSEPFPVSVLA